MTWSIWILNVRWLENTNNMKYIPHLNCEKNPYGATFLCRQRICIFLQGNNLIADLNISMLCLLLYERNIIALRGWKIDTFKGIYLFKRVIAIHTTYEFTTKFSFPERIKCQIFNWQGIIWWSPPAPLRLPLLLPVRTRTPPPSARSLPSPPPRSALRRTQEAIPEKSHLSWSWRRLSWAAWWRGTISSRATWARAAAGSWGGRGSNSTWWPSTSSSQNISRGKQLFYFKK